MYCSNVNNTKCQPFYNKINDVCKYKCSLDNCVKCTSVFATKCYECEKGYYLSTDNSACIKNIKRVLI
jgi:hypothetical protein